MSMSRIRVIDIETTGFKASDEIVEIGAVDVFESDIIAFGNDLVRPKRPIPYHATRVHGISNRDVEHCLHVEHHLLRYMDTFGTDTVTIFAAHNWNFEMRWLGAYVGDRRIICTLKCARQAWPDAPNYKNQGLREWLRLSGDPSFEGPAHRALPDAYVTALILNRLLACSSLEQLLEWSAPRKSGMCSH